MLTKVGASRAPVGVPAAKAHFPSPAVAGLEYASPARGCWNIVHTGMLVPQAHEIFICGASCLRGVVLTAAEMNAHHRFSTVEIRENNLLDGDLEDLIIEGVTDVLNRLPKQPPVVLIYTSCIHHFAGCDLDMIYSELRSRFPDIDFGQAFMNPIMRKSGLTPDQLIRKGMCDLLKPRPLNSKAVMLLNWDQPTNPEGDLPKWLRENGFVIHENTSCKTYDEYQAMAESAWYLSYNLAYNPAAGFMEQRLGGKALYLPLSFSYEEIDAAYSKIGDVLGIVAPASHRLECDAALAETKHLIGDTPIYLDYTYCARPLSLARYLLDAGFRVERVYVDTITGEERNDFDYLKEHYPDLLYFPTVHYRMRFGVEPKAQKILAIGQKAAYFGNTNYFVNVVSGGGMTGYQAILKTLALMQDAYLTEKDMRSLIQIKGMGCEACK